MGKVAFLFPGQGAQSVGMGRVLAEAAPELGVLFDEADRVLGFPLRELMFNGPEDQLTLTENAQPALVTAALAALKMTLAGSTVRPDYVAGHSLGEYAAICAAGGFSFAEALRLVRLRGKAMQAAVPVGVGGMAAMLSMEAAIVEEVCRQAADELGQVCVPANFNDPAQIVISGHKTAVERAISLAKERGGKRCILLAVSAPFHSPLMQPAAEAMAAALAQTSIADLTIPLIANVTAEVVTSGEQVRTLLVQQVTGAVRWEATIRRLRSLGVETFVEIGSGKVLTGLVKRIDKEARALTVNGPNDLEALQAL